MKNLLLKISLFAILFSSCNMGKQYANYRFGGKSSLNKNHSETASETEKNVTMHDLVANTIELSEMVQLDTCVFHEKDSIKEISTLEESKMMTVQNKSSLKTTSKKFVSTSSKIKMKKSKNNVFPKKSSMKEFNSFTASFVLIALIVGLIAFGVSGSLGVGILTALLIIVGGFILAGLVFALIIAFIVLIIEEIVKSSNHSLSQKSVLAKMKDSFFHINSKIDWSKVWDILVGIFLVGSLLATLITAIFLAGLSVLDIVFIFIALGVAILIGIGLTKLFEGIMPGMSRKKSHRPFHYYGMSVKGKFWIGTGIIALGIICAMIFGAPVIVYDILFSVFGAWAIACLLAGAVVAIFEGIAR